MKLILAKLVNRLLAVKYFNIRRRNVWFFEHYFCVATHVKNLLKSKIGASKVGNSNVLEFGCGDGITALGVSDSVGEIHAVDLTESFKSLPQKALSVINMKAVPANLHFHKVDEDSQLDFVSEYFDAAFSWSVFEHVNDVDRALREICRLLKKGGVFFIQIAPLYYSAYGSHLKRFGINPWEHLNLSDIELIDILKSRKLNIDKREQDLLYEEFAGDEYFDYLLNEYRSLNKITAEELTSLCEQVGFSVENIYLGRENWLNPNKDMLDKYGRSKLLNRELWLVLRKPK